MKNILLGIGADYSVIPYLSKLSFLLRSKGSFQYVCWDRQDGGNKLSSDTRSILTFSPKNKLTLLIGYICWWFSALSYLLFRLKGPAVIYASRFDSASAAAVASFFRSDIRLVFLDRDAYHMSYRLGVFRGLVKCLEKAVAARSLYHVVPGQSRNYTNADNVIVIQNTPLRSFYDAALSNSRNIELSEKFSIYINGWLVNSRGADVMLNACRELDAGDFLVYVAGEESNRYVKELRGLECVKYLGRLTPEDALSYYFVSDVVLSFYDDSIEVNRKAEPNKWYDCAFTGTPFITNSGIESFDLFNVDSWNYCIDYGNKDMLRSILMQLKTKKELGEFNRPAPYYAELGLEFWDESFLKLIDKAEAELLRYKKDFM